MGLADERAGTQPGRAVLGHRQGGMRGDAGDADAGREVEAVHAGTDRVDAPGAVVVTVVSSRVPPKAPLRDFQSVGVDPGGDHPHPDLARLGIRGRAVDGLQDRAVTEARVDDRSHRRSP